MRPELVFLTFVSLFLVGANSHALGQQQTSGAISKPAVLKGKVTDLRTLRSAGENRSTVRAGAEVDSADFSLEAKGRSVKPAVDGGLFESGLAPWPKFGSSSMDKFFEQARTPNLNAQVNASPVGSEGSPGSGTPTDKAANAPDQEVPLKSIIIRMTGFNEDTEITPKINLDAFNMANKLLETKKRKCVILLERTSVKLATTGYVDMSVNGNLIDFRKLVKNFMANGGEIVAHKKWCDEFMVQPKDMIGGVQVFTEPEVASLILDAEKMVDYATPNYPSNLRFHMGVP